MKRVLLLSAICLFTASAQPQNERLKLSPGLRMLISGDPAQEQAARKLLPINAGPQRLSPAVGAFVRFQGDADSLRGNFRAYGASINTVVGNLATAEIPIGALRAVAGLPDVVAIEESRPVKPHSDLSIPATGANQVWYGAGGPVDYTNRNRGAMPPPWAGNTGQNAIVGIVDTGIDLTHKDFLDSHGATRILSLWDQTATNGTPPASLPGFPAFKGNECSSQQINAIRANTDLVIAESFDEMMGVLLGGSGFGGPSTFSKGHSSVAVAAADFDLDGNMDVVSGNLDGTISWVKGNGHGGFAPQNPTTVVNNTAVQITAVATGDFNHDGFPDVVAVLNNTNQAAILLGNGDGTFQAPTFLNTGNVPVAVAVADLNGDGNLDLVIGNYNDGTISVFVGDGDGTFSQTGDFPVSTLTPVPPNLTTGVGTFPSYIAVGDFNGDGKPDLAIASFGRSVSNVNGSNLSIMLGNGDGTFGKPTSIYTQYFEMSIALGDFNGDGKLDIALQSYSVNVSVLLGNGDGTFGPQKDYLAGGNVGFYSGQNALVVADFNGDGILDIANLVRSNSAPASTHFYDGVGLLLGNGDGTFGKATVYPTGSTGNATYLATGDFHTSVCTEVDTDGHGTQVAGIAAGNGSSGGTGPFQTPYRYIGMAPEAPLIFVKHILDSQDIVDGVAYIQQKAAALNKPVVINLSLGSGFGPHDGTDNIDTMINGLTGPGTVVVASMGNDGEANLHADGTLANGGAATVPLAVPANLSTLVKMDLWYPGQDQFGVNITDPNGNQCMNGPIYPGNGDMINFQNPGCGPGWIAAPPVNVNNGDHEVQIYLLNTDNPPTAGTWSISMTGAGCGVDICVTKGSYDIWVLNTCTSPSVCVAFSGGAADNFKSIGEPATASSVIAVGSYVTKTSWIGWGTDFNTPTQSKADGTLAELSLTSSLGPRRTCSGPVCAAPVQKPDLVAPGEEIMAAYAANTLTSVCGYLGGACLDPDAQHVIEQGTSQAAPHVTGAVALLLSKYGKLSPCQVKQSLANARTDENTGPVPNENYGWGKLAIDLAIAQPPQPNKLAPNVVGLTLAQANAALSGVGLLTGGVTYAGSDTVAVGSVISQTPASGTAWCGGVDLVVSGIAVPNVADKTMADAAAAITAANLIAGEFTPTESLTVLPGDAIQTSPAAGTFVAPKATINIFISGIKVPDVTDLSKATALSAISAAGLPAGVMFTGSQAVLPGLVISQDPAAGTEVLPQTPVNLVVSGIQVPNVVGLALTAAQTALAGANLTSGSLVVVSSAVTPIGNIITEAPAAGTYVDVASAVTLVVSGATVPNEVGQDQNAAALAIVAAGLTVGNVSQAVSPVVPAGQVMNENPGGGSLVLPGSTVDLVISSGALGQITVPNVAGLSQANATTAFANAGLVLGTVTTANSATVVAGLVISESPAAGTAANPGSTVNIVISLGPAAQLQSITVTPANPSIAAGLSLQFAATGNYTNSTTQNLTNQVTWSASGAATITAAGLATTHAIGPATIGATLGAIGGSTALTAANPGACDTNHDGLQTITDIQSSLSQALGLSPPAANLAGSGVINVADVQITVNATLGKGCPAH